MISESGKKDLNDSDKAIRAALNSGDPTLALLGAIAVQIREIALALYDEDEPIVRVVDMAIHHCLEGSDGSSVSDNLDEIRARSMLWARRSLNGHEKARPYSRRGAGPLPSTCADRDTNVKAMMTRLERTSHPALVRVVVEGAAATSARFVLQVDHLTPVDRRAWDPELQLLRRLRQTRGLHSSPLRGPGVCC